MHIDGHRFVWEFYTNRKDQKQNVTILSEVKSWMQMQLQRTNVHLFVQYYCISQRDSKRKKLIRKGEKMLKKKLLGIMLAITVIVSTTGATSYASTTIKSRGIGNDGQGGSVSYTVGYNGNSTGKVYAGIKKKGTTKWYYGYASGKGTFRAAISYATKPDNCDDAHGVIK